MALEFETPWRWRTKTGQDSFLVFEKGHWSGFGLDHEPRIETSFITEKIQTKSGDKKSVLGSSLFTESDIVEICDPDTAQTNWVIKSYG